MVVKVGVSVSSSRGWISNGIVPCAVSQTGKLVFIKSSGSGRSSFYLSLSLLPSYLARLVLNRFLCFAAQLAHLRRLSGE